MSEKVTLLPCSGICKVVGTIVRQATYKVAEDLRPEDALLDCLPALVRGVKEDIEMLEYPVVVIDGCEERCANYALEIRGGQASATVFVPLIIAEAGKRIEEPEGKSRRELTKSELEIVDLVAEEIAKQVDRLKQE